MNENADHTVWSDMELREECGYVHGYLRACDDLKRSMDLKRDAWLLRLTSAQNEIKRRADVDSLAVVTPEETE